MTAVAQNRSVRFTIRMTPDEYQQLDRLVASTINTSLSDYCRQVLLKMPVNALCRNQSLDDFLADMLLLRKDLRHIDNLYSQVVRRLQMLKTNPELQHWLLINEQDKHRVSQLIEQIFTEINTANRIWSHA